MKQKFTALVVAGALGLSSCSMSAAGKPSGSTAAAKSRPNIVFVLTDDLSWNLVRYMPNLRRMQGRGTTFTDYFVTDSLCCPSRSTMFTGKYPHNTGVFTNTGTDGGYGAFNTHGNQNHTFATALSGAGYRTAMLGKYLNGYQPTDPVPPGWSEWDVAGNGYPEFNYALNENGRVRWYGHQPRDYLTDVLDRKGADFVGRSARAGKPFMLEVATFAPHAPSTPAPRDAKRFPELRAPRGPAFNEADTSDKPAWLKGREKLTRKQIHAIDVAFRKRVRAVQAVDKMIGDLQAAVRASGHARDTYLVFASDNGYHMGQHRLMPGKMTAFDSDIAVPLVVAGPGVAAGRRTDRLAQNTDLCPTFERLAGVTVPSSVDGLPLLPNGPAREGVLIEHHGPDRDPADPDHPARHSGNPPSYEAIRTKDAVYVEYADGEREYYDLRRDPYELTNTVRRPPDARRRALATALHTLEECSGGNCHQ